MTAEYIVPHEGNAFILQALVDTGLTLRLFVNNPPFKRGLTAKTLTEASFPGYEAIRMAGSLWKISEGTDKTPAATATAPFQMFLRTSEGEVADVYGWYLTARTGAVVCAERFGKKVPWKVERERDAVEVKPVLMFEAGE